MIAAQRGNATAFRILGAISFCHLLNDMMQSLIPAVYPILKQSYRLDFGQIGLITLTSQLTASLLQPLVGLYTDRRPTPYSLAVGMTFTMVGLIRQLSHNAGRLAVGYITGGVLTMISSGVWYFSLHQSIGIYTTRKPLLTRSLRDGIRKRVE